MKKSKDMMTYTAVIKYNGIYYLTHTLNAKKQFEFQKLDTEYDENFKMKNKKLRQLIGLQIQRETAFSNTEYNSENIYRAVSLYKIKAFQPQRIAVFCCDKLNETESKIHIPYCKAIQDECSDTTRSIMGWLKYSKVWAPCLMYFAYFLTFFASAWVPGKESISLDVVAFFFAVINYFLLLFEVSKTYKRIVAWRPSILQSIVHFDCLLEIAVLAISLLLAFACRNVMFDSGMLSRFSLSFIAFDAFIRLMRLDQ